MLSSNWSKNHGEVTRLGIFHGEKSWENGIIIVSVNNHENNGMITINNGI